MLVNRRGKGKELERKIFKLLKLREGIKKRTKKETREEKKYDAEKFAGRVSRVGSSENKGKQQHFQVWTKRKMEKSNDL